MAIPQRQPSYAANVVGLVVVANATDIFSITGSASRIVRIRKIVLTGIQTTAGHVLAIAVKRSAAATGAATTQTAVPLDSDGSSGTAASAVVRSYTANPTPGALVGRVMAIRNLIPAAATAVAQEPFVFEFGPDDPLATLRTTSEVLAINLNAVTVTGGALDISIFWTEE